jgi:cell pole-organizing protein PopZ
MAEPRSDQEPSIEEILASIREIISDDDAAVAAKPAEPAHAPEIELPPVILEPAIIEKEEEKEEDEILDLTPFSNIADPLDGIDFSKPDKFDIEFTDPLPEPAPEIAAIPEPEPAPEPEPEVFIAPAPEITPEPVFDTVPEIEKIEDALEEQVTQEIVKDVKETVAMGSDDSLLTDHAKSASMDSLTRLAQNIAISKAGQGGTLEDIVREMVRPMLRDWLDRNLPPMIERMVERELERLVKQAMDR